MVLVIQVKMFHGIEYIFSFFLIYILICFIFNIITLGSSIDYVSDESYNPYIDTILNGMYLNRN